MADADFTAVDLVNRDLILQRLGPLMVNKVFPEFDEKERMHGGECGKALLNLIYSIGKTHGPHTQTKQTFIDQDYVFQKAFEAAGEISPRAAGVIAALVEYISWSEMDCCPNLRNWSPESGMSDKNIQEERIEKAIRWTRVELELE